MLGYATPKYLIGAAEPASADNYSSTTKTADQPPVELAAQHLRVKLHVNTLDPDRALPLIRVLVITQLINGLLLPVLLVAITRLASDRKLMGARANGPVYNLIAWLTVVIISALSLLLIIVPFFS